jgi:aminoglycoside phosphotransferase family enzyme/predicted kinase
MTKDWPSVVSFLADGAGGPHRADERIETHAACVFLIGDLAYKIKKPVDLGFLDFSTMGKRRIALEREYERNQLYARGNYLRVEPITLTADGTLQIGGDGTPVEYVLIMRRFADESLLADKPELVTGTFAENLGRIVANHHASAPVIADAWPKGFEYVLKTNSSRLSRFEDMLGPEKVAQLTAETEAAFAAQRGLVCARQSAGFVRRCHGDLHLANIFLEGGKPVLFDCIEFDDCLSDIDILYDLAFLLMDILHRGKREGANRVLNGYLDEALRSFDSTLTDGLVLMPLFLSARAAVRAHVTAQMGQADRARSYLSDALARLKPTPPCLMAVGGLSGTGKTFFSRQHAPGMGAAPGAIVLRSDEIRKRLWKVRPIDRLPPEAYTEGESKRVYGTMLDEARNILRAGHSAILDAVFLRAEERRACAKLAEAAGVPFEGCWLEAPEDVLRQRVFARADDASDADISVLERQLAADPGEIDWTRRRG